MITVYSTIVSISAAIIGIFSVLIFLGDKKLSNKIYSLVSFLAMLWSMAIAGNLMSDSYEWILFWIRFGHFITILLAGTFFYFCLSFPEEKRPNNWILSFIVITGVVLGYLHLFTDLIIRNYYMAGIRIIDRGYNFGELGFLFHFFLTLYFSAGILVLVRKLARTENPGFKRQIRLILAGSLFGIVPGSIVAMIFALFEKFSFYWMGPSLVLLWVIFTSYVIVKYETLKVKLMLSELAVVAMGLILFANIFVAEIFKLGVIGRTTIFLAFVIFGYFFIKSATEGEDQREWLSILSLELKDFNQNLESRVITETMEAEKSKVHIETVSDTITNGLVEYDKNLVIQRVNKAAERMLGIDRTEVIGLRIDPNEKREKWESVSKVVSPNIEVCDVCDVAINKPIKRDIQVTTVPILDGYFRMFRDVTRENIITKSKNEFISIIAHQFKSPLCAIRDMLKLLTEDKKGKFKAEQLKIIQNMREVNARTISLVDELFDVTRIEEGHFKYKFRQNSIVNVVEQVVNEYKQQAEVRGITLTFTKEEIPTTIFDEHKMSLVVKNLVDNAIYYTKEKGFVEVKVKKDGDTIFISVKDNGIGIPEDQKDKLFSKLFRAPNALKIRPDGSGLGLFIAKEIVENHDGEIELKTEENKGTEVLVKLPFNNDKK